MNDCLFPSCVFLKDYIPGQKKGLHWFIFPENVYAFTQRDVLYSWGVFHEVWWLMHFSALSLTEYMLAKQSFIMYSFYIHNSIYSRNLISEFDGIVYIDLRR
jgi:hypothetical protein